ncbi:MAG: DUF4153 domain-containing protein [Pseudomonadota bacterium]
MAKLPKLSLKHLGDAMAGSLRRFPLPLAAAALAALQAIILTHREHLWEGWDQGWQRFAFLVLAFFGLLAVKLLVESRRWPLLVQIGLTVVCLGLLAWRVFILPAEVGDLVHPPLIFLLAGLVLLVTVAPFFRAGVTNNAFWDFNRASWLAAALGLAAAVILAVGATSAVYAIETLFNVRIDHEITQDIWTLCFCVLWPWLTLANVPRHFDSAQSQIPWGLKVLAGYILVPLVLVYLVILYAYLAQIVILWDLPKGQVATLTSAYATLGVATYLMIYPLRDQLTLARLYHRWFFPALLPPLGLLAVALWQRISDYGVTEHRYAVGLLGFWLLLGVLFFSWRRAPRLVLLPLALSLFLGAASVGPWGAVELSTRSQLAELTALLKANGLLADGRVRKTDASVPFETTKRIGSIISYFTRAKRRTALAPIFADSGVEPFDEANVEQLMGAMGLDYIHAYQTEVSLTFQAMRQGEAMDVAGFDLVGQISLYDDTPFTLRQPETDRSYQIRLMPSGQAITVTGTQLPGVTLPLGPLLERMRGHQLGDEEQAREMVLEATTEGLSVRLYLTMLHGQIPEDTPKVTSAYGMIALKDKSP